MRVNLLETLYLFLLEQMSAWWFLTFTAPEIKDNVVFLTGVQYLFDTISPDRIEIPKFVLDYDQQVCLIS